MIDLIYPERPAPLARGTQSTKAAEMLPLVDEGGNVLAQAPRSFFHHNATFALHPVVHLHIINRSGAIYLQKRSATKKLLPLHWDTAVGGHVSYGEHILEALFREASEELGFYDFNPVSLDTYVYQSGTEKELVNVFGVVGDFELKPDHDEVEEGRWWTREEIGKAVGKDILTPNFESEYKRIRTALEALL